MARLARVELFAADEVAVVRVMNRVVRRCFLLGDDAVTGKNYDHRKQWIENELQKLAGAMGIDLLGSSILSNHFHLILRSRPDVVALWDDTEVARGWLLARPRRKNENGSAAEPIECELNSIRHDPDRLAQIRLRLSDISWWMRLLCQTIAMRANREDGETGRQGRFEPSDDRRMAETLSGNASPAPDRFLTPLELDEHGGEPGQCANRSGSRCSDKGFLPIPVAAYLELLDWTARQTVPGKRGSTPSDAPPILERLKVSATTWCELVSNFGRLFSTVAGHPRIVDTTRSRRGHRRFHITARVREVLPMDP